MALVLSLMGAAALLCALWLVAFGPDPAPTSPAATDTSASCDMQTMDDAALSALIRDGVSVDEHASEDAIRESMAKVSRWQQWLTTATISHCERMGYDHWLTFMNRQNVTCLSRITAARNITRPEWVNR